MELQARKGSQSKEYEDCKRNLIKQQNQDHQDHYRHRPDDIDQQQTSPSSISSLPFSPTMKALKLILSLTLSQSLSVPVFDWPFRNTKIWDLDGRIAADTACDLLAYLILLILILWLLFHHHPSLNQNLEPNAKSVFHHQSILLLALLIFVLRSLPSPPSFKNFFVVADTKNSESGSTATTNVERNSPATATLAGPWKSTLQSPTAKSTQPYDLERSTPRI